MSNYPMGTEFDPNAPWNEPMYKDVEIEVEYTVVLRKTIKVKLPENHVDWSIHEIETEAKNYIKDNVRLPQEHPDFKDWEVETEVEL